MYRRTQACLSVLCAVEWGKIEAQNLMFNTKIGAGKSGRQGFLRPETAQGMFTSFTSIYRHFRERFLSVQSKLVKVTEMKSVPGKE